MAWPMIFAGIGAAGQIFSGFSSFFQGNRNARAAEMYARWNATNLMVFGAWQADQITKFSQFNAKLILKGAAANARNARSVAQYNADLQSLVADHNAELLMDEAAAVWDAEKLDEKILAQKIAQRVGEQVTGYAAANVITNEGTPLEAVIDTKTQGEFEKHIMRFNANEQARTLLNEATKGQWEAELAGQQMIYEASVQGMNAMNSARVTAAGILGQGKYDSMMTKWSAMQNAQKTLLEGSWQASQFRTQATNDLFSSFFKAGSSIAGGYASMYTPDMGSVNLNAGSNYAGFNWGGSDYSSYFRSPLLD